MELGVELPVRSPIIFTGQKFFRRLDILMKRLQKTVTIIIHRRLERSRFQYRANCR